MMPTIRFGGDFYNTVAYNRTSEVKGEKTGKNFIGLPKYEKNMVEEPITVQDLVRWGNDQKKIPLSEVSALVNLQQQQGYAMRIQAAGFNQLHEDLVQLSKK